MNTRLLNAVAFAAMLAAGSAFAADAPAPAAAPTPPVTPSAMPATTPAAMPAATPSSMPTAVHPRPVHKAIQHVSTCTMSVRKAEKVLASSKVPAEKVALAWQHIDAAKQARMNHQAAACKTESQMAKQILEGKI
jgi:hypothetical protein